MKDQLIPWKKQALRQEYRKGDDPFDRLHREINGLFDSYFRGVGPFGRRVAGTAGFELSETDDEIRVKAELPGMDEKEIQVSVEEDEMLTIRGERREERETKKRNYHVSEISYGGYSRTVPLPAPVDAAKAKAKFKHGVLTLTLPKTEQAREARKRIPVTVD